MIFQLIKSNRVSVGSVKLYIASLNGIITCNAKLYRIKSLQTLLGHKPTPPWGISLQPRRGLVNVKVSNFMI